MHIHQIYWLIINFRSSCRAIFQLTADQCVCVDCYDLAAIRMLARPSPSLCDVHASEEKKKQNQCFATVEVDVLSRFFLRFTSLPT